jgi:hypothetical protein
MVRTRYIFNMLNLPLKDEVKYGPFTLKPIDEGQAELRKRRSMDSDPVISAIGELPIPEEVGRDERWSYVDSQPLREMELLLSFAERRYVEAYNPSIQRYENGEWKFDSWRQHLSHFGQPHGVAWYVRQSDLQAYMERCLPILSDQERGKKSGLLLALEMFRSNFQDDFVELQYLKTWIALEILYSRYFKRDRILTEGRFARVRRAVRVVLIELQGEGQLDEAQFGLITAKLPELNRQAAADQALRFVDEILAEYPAQDVTSDEMQLFVKIRNSITHGLTAGLPEDAYGDRLHEEHMRLKSLLERIILAMLGQDANLLTFSWRYWMQPR